MNKTPTSNIALIYLLLIYHNLTLYLPCNLMLLTGNTEITLQTNVNYIDLGTAFQLTCTIHLGQDKILHLDRESGPQGVTCGACDQVLAAPPEYAELGLCTEDTVATYSISCAWNANSTVMTFTVDGVTSLEFATWRCYSGMRSNNSSVDIVEFSK